MAVEELLERGSAFSATRQVEQELSRRQAGKFAMHASCAVAHRHRAERVAVIAVPETYKLVSLSLAAIQEKLYRHLERDLDCDRSGIGKEHMVEIARQQPRQARGQGRGLLMRQPRHHHMRHGFELALDGFANMRMVVAVAG